MQDYETRPWGKSLAGLSAKVVKFCGEGSRQFAVARSTSEKWWYQSAGSAGVG
jgi:hypothetical protein